MEKVHADAQASLIATGYAPGAFGYRFASMCDGGAARQMVMKEMPRWLTHVSSGSLVGLNRSRANTDVVAEIMPIFDEAEDLDELIAADKIGVCAA